ncbi:MULTISPECIES: hypothetical protein [unclassified Mycobacterium]|uniref:hypothetical protein n=1 Tax=unclassified Mycobacterium TaxID=2642494 RepID=UPI0029C76363|nr:MULTISPECIES: hypothetical protein [unclassified Mycobacterium]
MTQASDSPHRNNTPRKGADDLLRDQLLRDLVGECLSLSHIDSVVANSYAADSATTRQVRLMATIGSLLTERLLVVGDIVGGSNERVEPWKVPIVQAVARLHERYVTNYDDWEKWGWTTWFALTELGERAAEAL